MAELRRLTEFCDYGATLGNMLRDRLVCGIKHERIQQRLLAQGAALTLETALDVAQSMESAIENSTVIKSYQEQDRHAGELYIVEERKAHGKISGRNCYRCGNNRHQAKDCPFRDKECYHCRKQGHISKVCRKKIADTRYVQEEALSEQEQDEVFNVYQMNSYPKQPPYKVTINVNSVPTEFEIDTGAALTVINKKTLKKLTNKSHVNLEPTSIKLRTYTGEVIRPIERVSVKMEYQDRIVDNQLVVVEYDRPNLLGRDILNKNIFYYYY